MLQCAKFRKNRTSKSKVIKKGLSKTITNLTLIIEETEHRLSSSTTVEIVSSETDKLSIYLSISIYIKKKSVFFMSGFLEIG